MVYEWRDRIQFGKFTPESTCDGTRNSFNSELIIENGKFYNVDFIWGLAKRLKAVSYKTRSGIYKTGFFISFGFIHILIDIKNFLILDIEE